MENTEDLLFKAKEVLTLNDRGNYTCPNYALYPYQWLWDSCFIAIGLAHLDTERAKQEILSLFEGQWSNGMVPNMIMWKLYKKGIDANTHEEHIWKSWLNPAAPDDIQTSGITQPPMIAEAVVKIGEKMNKAERIHWYKQVYGPLLNYHTWLFDERAPHKEGLVLLIHPWECGLDNTPPWMEELSEHSLPFWIKVIIKLRIDALLGLVRKDTHYVKGSQRISNVEALSLYAAHRRLRRKRYVFSKIIEHSLFAIEDLTFNSIFIRANRHLKDIAKTIGKELPKDFSEQIEKS